MGISFVNLQAQYLSYEEEINAAVLGVMRKGEFILGAEVSVLESKLSAYTGARHVISCGNGTDALMLALMAIGVQENSEVITPSFSFIAAAEATAVLGAKPIFVDITQKTYNMDVDQLADKITAKTRAIIPISLFGQVADLDEINAVAKFYGEKFGHKIYVIEDAAQSFGAEYKGRKSCHLSDIACTSFYPSKPLGCYGDGGAVFTDDNDLAGKIKALRAHGQTGRYQHAYVGLNSRLDTIQAAILNVKLKYFSDELKKRQALGERYDKLLEKTHVITPAVAAGYTHIYAQYPIFIKNRARLLQRFEAAAVPAVVHYPVPLHLQRCFQYLAYADSDFPVSVEVAKNIVCLPICAFLRIEDQDFIVNCIKEDALSGDGI